MTFIPGKNMTAARDLARSNADRFGAPYRIFLDTSGNLRVERDHERGPTFGTDTTIEVIHPESPMNEYTVQVTWSVDATSPAEAARMFLDFMRDERTDEDGNSFSVNLGNKWWDVVLYGDRATVSEVKEEER